MGRVSLQGFLAKSIPIPLLTKKIVRDVIAVINKQMILVHPRHVKKLLAFFLQNFTQAFSLISFFQCLFLFGFYHTIHSFFYTN